MDKETAIKSCEALKAAITDSSDALSAIATLDASTATAADIINAVKGAITEG